MTTLDEKLKEIDSHAKKVQQKHAAYQLKVLQEISEPGSTDILKEVPEDSVTLTVKQILVLLAVVALFAWAVGRSGGENRIRDRVENHTNTCWSETRQEVYGCYVISIGR